MPRDANILARGGKTIAGVHCRDVATSTCLQLRRAARLTTQTVDAHLASSGLTVGQFGILVQLFACARPPTMKELSTLIGMDPTTLNRTLKPLEGQKLVSTASDKEDRRARCIQLTAAGQKTLARAMPLWRAADDELRRTMGQETSAALSGVLRLANEKLRKSE
jgi:DNA-binding MarR family transcriptional regulator